MPDREKVIKGLTHCTAWAGLHECQPKVGDDCPYVDEADCKLTIMLDALELLKEQEKWGKRILSIVWDVLHSGVSTDTKTDQDFVYELILEKVESYNKDVKRDG